MTQSIVNRKDDGTGKIEGSGLHPQVGVSVLKKSMDVPAQSALFLLESVVAPVAEVSTPVPVVDGSLGQNIDVRV